MRTYHVYSDGPGGLAVIRATSDAIAVEVARRGDRLARIMEVWERERLVARIAGSAIPDLPGLAGQPPTLANQGFRPDI